MLNSINSFARLASDRSEVVGASLVLVMITMMVIPLSPFLLDILVALNICVTVVLLLSAILLDSPLSFSSFPAMLLMITLFRLSLNISTTRQILIEADAGEIITTFGEFVIGGNLAVGLVIFLIISVVNFLVITKGSERVAEVAARFSLDAMPGKQMSIDGDVRAGNITQEDAKQKRSVLEKESQLFGAMDGAIKFVKNDAIAGLVITLINLIGGIAIGMVQLDMEFAEAGHTYSILSVGDGLISIIPSLMTSIAAGLIVTRVTKGSADGSNTAQDMIRELSSNPKALQLSGVFCACFALVPGMPAPVFLIAAAALLFKSFSSTRVVAEELTEDPDEKFQKMLENASEKGGRKVVDDLMEGKVFNPIEVRIPKIMEPTSKTLLFSILKFSRNELVEHSGMVYPTFTFKEDDRITDVQIGVFGVPMLTLYLADKRLHVHGTLEKLKQVQDILSLEFDDEIGRYSYFCEPVHKNKLDSLGISYTTFEKRWAQMMEVLVVSKSKDFFTLNDVQKHLSRLGETHNEMIKELTRVMPASKTTEVIQRLLVERVSIRNANLILASLIDWGQRERDSLIITEQVRRALLEQITHQYCVGNTLHVLSLDHEFEQYIRENLRSDGSVSFLDVDSVSINRVIKMVEKQFESWAHLEKVPVVVCSLDCRPHFRALIQDKLKCVPVMSFQEISPNRELQLLGTINFDESLLDANDNQNTADQ